MMGIMAGTGKAGGMSGEGKVVEGEEGRGIAMGLMTGGQ